MITLEHGTGLDELSIIDKRALVETDLKSDVLDTLNSTNAVLVANGQFTGQWVDVSAFKSVFIYCLANINSAAVGLKMQFSADSNVVDWSWEIATVGNQSRTFKLPTYYKYFRIIFINSSSLQGSFRLNVIKSFKTSDLTTQTSEFTIVATGVANTAVAAQIPAQGTGTIPYITSILVEKFATAGLTAGTAPFICTSANLNGFAPNIANDAQPQGTLQIPFQQVFPVPLRANTPNATTSIGTPAIPNAICKVILTYYVGV